MARSIYAGLAHLFAALIVVQLFLAGLGAFTTVHNKKFDDNNFAAHSLVGTVMIAVALVILLVAAVGRWSPMATRLSGALFGLMVVQSLLGGAGADNAPVLGGLHVLNAAVITAVTYLLIRESRRRPATA